MDTITTVIISSIVFLVIMQAVMMYALNRVTHGLSKTMVATRQLQDAVIKLNHETVRK